MPKIDRELGTLYYRARGAGPETVVLLHDYFGTHQSWDYQILQLSRYFLVLAPDLRGHGKSESRDGGLAINDMAEDVIAMLGNIGIERAHIVGCSHGAVVALHLARCAANRVATIVVTSVPDLADPEVIAYGREYVSQVYPRLETELEQIHGTGSGGYTRDVLLRNFVQSLDTPPDDHLDALGKASSIQVPTLVLGGDRDPVMPPERALQLARTIPDAELGILPNTGHLVHRESPALFTETLLDYIWRNKRRLSSATG